MNIFEEDILQQMIDEFLNNLDPYGNRRIIFSDIVDLFSRINFDHTHTIMDKYCIKDNDNNNLNSNNMNNNDKKEENNK